MRKVPRIEKSCDCGNIFQTTAKKLEKGRGKYCSFSCARSREVPQSQKDSQSLKMKGRHCSPFTQFKKNTISWNKGIKLPQLSGEKHWNWKGDKVGYMGLHDWVEKELGKPFYCEHCDATVGRFEWANKSHEYKRRIDDWIRLCKKCHIAYDRQGSWGVANRRFAL